LALFFTIIGFFLKKWYEDTADEKEKLKETIRRTEISLTQTLNQLITSIEQLEDFIVRARLIISKVRGIRDEVSFCLQETNFPPIINIYFDEELLKMKHKSYYIHNKIIV